MQQYIYIYRSHKSKIAKLLNLLTHNERKSKENDAKGNETEQAIQEERKRKSGPQKRPELRMGTIL